MSDPAGQDPRSDAVAASGECPDSHAELCAALGNPAFQEGLLERALTHRSFAYENGGLPTNERLEFLGDAVLGVVVTETLFRSHPELSEGRLAKLRAAVVNARALAEVARTIGLGENVKLGRGEEITGGRTKASILSDTLEAVIGAVYLSGGFQAAGAVVHLLFDPLMEAAAALGAGLDWKTSLQELTAEHSLGVPEYIIDDEGPDHAKTFTAEVKVGDGRYGRGTGRSKKEAEQQAAETAYREIVAEVGGGQPVPDETKAALLAGLEGIERDDERDDDEAAQREDPAASGSSEDDPGSAGAS